MLKKIKSVTGMGVFSGYRWPTGSALPDFKRWNLIYGQNGSGKTTLSRLFQALTTGRCEKFTDLKYSIETDSGTTTQASPGSIPIRVFNADYVVSNIGELEGEINPIFIVGKDQKDLLAELQANELEYTHRSEQLKSLGREIESKEKDKGKEFTNIASQIGLATKGLTSRTYRKPQAEASYKKIENFEVLSDEDLSKHGLTAEQKKLAEIEEIKFSKVQVEGESISLAAFIRSLLDSSADITTQTAESIVIPRLQQNAQISEWVEKGIELHKTGDDCEFCGSRLTDDRLKALAAHFNDADQSLKQKILSLIANYEDASAALQMPDVPSKFELFEELQDEYEDLVRVLKKEIKIAQTSLEDAKLSIQEKLSSRTESIEFAHSFQTDPLAEALGKINVLLTKHNEKSSSFEKARDLALEKIEAHYLSTIESVIEEFEIQIEDLKTQENVLRNGDAAKNELSLIDLKSEISRKRGLIANTQKAAEELTRKLEIFLGRKELRFEPEGDGYRIYRNGVAAQGLSEGEKTAIAFIYFSVQLDDQNFDKTKGVIVVDDPISSLDASSTYQAFAFLKECVKDAKQVFLLTHNFDFLKLLLNWIKNVKEVERGYYMLHAKLGVDGERTTRLEILDKALSKNGSEYVFLFKQIRDYQCDGTIENAYHMPNIIRKALEQFLEFMCPTDESFYKKLEKINFDPIKKTALNKYAQDFSHPTGKGLDPSLVDETRNNAKHFIEMIKSVAPTHYSNLDRN